MSSSVRGNEENSVKVRCGRVESVDLYEVKDSELDLLEKGSPAAIQLNFAIFLISLALSCFSTLCTTKDFRWPIAQNAFLFITIVGFFLGGYLLIIWWKTNKSISDLVKTIKKRMDTPIQGHENPPCNLPPISEVDKTDEPIG